MRFMKPKNTLEGYSKAQKVDTSAVAQEPTIECPRCHKSLRPEELEHELQVCPYCRYHFKINARHRLHLIADADSFQETDADLRPHNLLDFPGYTEKLQTAALQSAELDSVVCGRCTIDGHPVAIFVMEPNFMMGSMGSVAGEKITRTLERATAERLPVVGFAVSGGARMQEGMISLLQMAKTSGAVKLHSDAGQLFVCVLTNPTTGGVTASFAMEADIIIAEPYALIGFAGPRVIEQTVRKKLPAGFQSAEFQLAHGFLDDIVDRKSQKKYLSQLLALHASADGSDTGR
ncbi:MAG: acetyl-CoA carboxylase, carboxyltransferase subunit beta [Actinomycetia bacterium]|nr:acetyl-CoA carboxylase, carboxyltransferase subunit beta [Actinomycetes bacterium]